MPTIKHGSIDNKTDFWSRNFLKIAGTADFRRKNGISWISRAVLYIFHETLHTDAKLQYLKCDRARFSKKNIIFRPKSPEICRKNRFFGIFSRFHHKFFLIFCTKMRICNAEFDFWEKIFSGRKCRKYAGNPLFCWFSLDLILIFLCLFFSHNCWWQYPIFSKNCWNSFL